MGGCLKAGDVCDDISGRRKRQPGDQAAAPLRKAGGVSGPFSDWALNTPPREGQQEVKMNVGWQFAGSFSLERLEEGK